MTETQTTEPHNEAQPDPLIGSIFAQKYRIIELLGAGGMGAVYKAEHTLMGRVVALKLLHSHLSANADYLRRFEKEARIACRITHPNAILLHDFGIEGSTPFLVMQYIEGRSLKDLLRQAGALSLDRINRIASQICAATAQAHSLQIVHRDLKPDNILISQDDRGRDTAHVLDFGVAKFLGFSSSDSSVAATQTGMFSGTPQYMSPEQASQRPVDARSDVYSMGVVLYEMLTGEVPFKSDSPLGMLIEHVQKMPTPVRDLKPFLNIPAAVNEVVMKALEKDPNERFASMDELSRALEAAVSACSQPLPVQGAAPIHDQAMAVGPVTVEPVAIMRPARGKGARVAWSIAGACLVCGVLGTAAVIVGLRGTSDDGVKPVALFSEELQRASVQEPKGSESAVPPSSEPSLPLDTPKPDTSLTPAPPESMVVAGQTSQPTSDAFDEGRTLLREKDYIRAGLAFKKVLAVEDSHLLARLYLGLCFQRLDKAERALEEFKRAIEQHPDSALAHFMLSAFHAERSDRAPALESLQRAVALSPEAARWASDDQSFQGLAGDPGFQALTKASAAQ